MVQIHLLLFVTILFQQRPSEDALARAVEQFRQAEPAAQIVTMREAAARIEALDDPGLVKLRELRDRARRELRPAPWPGPRFFDHAEYAPVQLERHYVQVDSDDAKSQVQLMRPWENATEYACRFRYDYAGNQAIDLGEEPSPEQRLLDHLAGFPPDTDLLVAWLEKQFDHDRKLDRYADYFDHAYCDRLGNCYSEITIYDAFASQSTVEMSDIDVIAYARNVLGDRSFRSPIPPDSRRQRLYRQISDGFLLHFRHRTLCEALANLMVNPDAILRDDHEGLRERALVVLALDKEDPRRIRARLKRARDRDGFVDAIDALTRRDKKLIRHGLAWAEKRNASRWKIAFATYDVLRKKGFLLE